MTTEPSTLSHRALKALRRSWLAGCLALAAYFVLLGWSTRATMPPAVELDTRSAARVESLAPHTKPIDKIRVGERVIGTNPNRSDVDPLVDEPNPENWRRLRLRMSKPNGGVLHIELLRPRQWIEGKQARVGGTIWLDLRELDAVGTAEVVAIDPCPPIKPGAGRVVTGTFAHPASDNVLNVVLEGDAKPIGVTGQHLFWSHTRNEFVPAERLEVDEQVLTFRGDALRVVSVLPRPGPSRVYNIEVLAEHVYHVASAGILVHNCSVSIAADANLWMDKVPGGAATRSLFDDILSHSDMGVVLTKAKRAEINPTASQAARLAGTSELTVVRSSNVAQLGRTHGQANILVGKFGLEDLKLVQTAKMRGLPVVTANWRMINQINSNPILRAEFGGVKFFVPSSAIPSGKLSTISGNFETFSTLADLRAKL